MVLVRNYLLRICCGDCGGVLWYPAAGFDDFCGYLVRVLFRGSGGENRYRAFLGRFLFS